MVTCNKEEYLQLDFHAVPKSQISNKSALLCFHDLTFDFLEVKAYANQSHHQMHQENSETCILYYIYERILRSFLQWKKLMHLNSQLMISDPKFCTFMLQAVNPQDLWTQYPFFFNCWSLLPASLFRAANSEGWINHTSSLYPSKNPWKGKNKHDICL